MGFILSRIAADEAEILSIAVARSRRGKGLGRRLIDVNLRAALLRRGLTVSTPHAHVAQCAIDRGALLLTHDAVFLRTPGVEVISELA